MKTKEKDSTLMVAVEEPPPPPLTVDVSVDEPSSTDNDGRTMLHSNRLSRAQEKEKLQTLNDRLVAYIDRVKCLETDNSRLVRELYSYKKHNTKEMAEVKKLFDSETRDLRTALDLESSVNSQLELNNKRKTMQLNEVGAQLNKFSNKLKGTVAYKVRFVELNTKYSQIAIENTNLKNTCETLAKELSGEIKKVKEFQKKMEESVFQRKIAENKLQSLKENFNFNVELYKPLNNKKTARHTEVLCNVDVNLVNRYEVKLQSELKVLQQQAEKDVKQKKKEISDVFDNKLQKLQNELRCKNKSLEIAHEDLNVANIRISELLQQINDLMVINNDCLIKMRELEKIKENQRKKYLMEIQGLEQQLTTMHDDISQKVYECQDLMFTKVEFDMEISAYRKLLESEEKRLNITPNTLAPQNSKGIKRKLPYQDETNLKFISPAVTIMEIKEVCPDGKYIKLFNNGSTEIDLIGYKIVDTVVGGNVSVVFTFEHSVKLETGGLLAIWSSSTESQTYSLKTSLMIMNKKSWAIGVHRNITLLNSTGQEVAFCQLEKSPSHKLGNLQMYKKCIIM